MLFRSRIEQVEATQIKEKFGSLRFYTNSSDAAISALIDFAESMSQRTCDMCGNPGKSTGEDWIVTLCDACFNKHKTK